MKRPSEPRDMVLRGAVPRGGIVRLGRHGPPRQRTLLRIGAFVTEALAVQWAEELRREIEGGLFEQDVLNQQPRTGAQHGSLYTTKYATASITATRTTRWSVKVPAF